MDILNSYNLEKFDEDVKLLVRQQLLDLKAKFDTDVQEVLQKASEFQEKRTFKSSQQNSPEVDKTQKQEDIQNELKENVIPCTAIQVCSPSSIRRSSRSRSHPPITSPILTFKVRKRRRKFFPKISDDLLRKLTDDKSSSIFVLPEEFDSYIGIKKSIAKDPIKLDLTNFLGDENLTQEKIVTNQPDFLKNPVNVMEKPISTTEKFNKEIKIEEDSTDPLVQKKTMEVHLVSLKVLESLLLIAVTTNNQVRLYKTLSNCEKWKEVGSWERPIENIMWMMQSDEKPHQLLLQHNSTSLWLSYVILEGSGYVDHYTTNISGTCVAVLPDLSVATSNSKLEKYVWDGKTSEFNLKQTMQHPEKPVLSLCNLNEEPEALVGCTSTDMFIWNHTNGLMLQKFSLGDKGIAKSIVNTTCREGLLNIVLKIKSRGELICCSLLCNPLNGNLQVIKKRKSRETQPRQQYYYKGSSRFPFSDSALQGLLSQL